MDDSKRTGPRSLARYALDRLKLRRRTAAARRRLSLPQDWSDVGRWVLAEAMHRALSDSTPRTIRPRLCVFPRLAVAVDSGGREGRA